MVENITDFETDDALFKLTRHYRNFTSSNIGTYHQIPLNLAQGWHFNFAWELHIDEAFQISDKLTLLSPDGAAYNFRRNDDGSIVPVDSDAKQINIKRNYPPT